MQKDEIIKIPNQGNNITPQSINIRVVWFNDEDIWYQKIGSNKIYTTTIERFNELVR